MVNPLLLTAGWIAERFDLLFADTAVKSAIIVVTCLVISLFIRRSSGANRHLIWTLALASVFCTPLLSGIIPGREVKPVSELLQVQETPRPHVLLPAAPNGIASVNGHVTPASLASVQADPTEHEEELANIDAQAPTLLASIEAVLAIFAASLWLCGFLFVLCRISIRLTGLAILNRLGTAPNAFVADVSKQTVGQIGLRRSVKFLQASESSTITVPVTWGYWRPVIYLPYSSRDWPEDLLRSALQHELAHVERADWMVQMLAEFACAIHWFNPFVWCLLRGLKQEAERAADDLAVNRGQSPAEYARHLMQIAILANAGKYAPNQATAMVRRCNIDRRISTILNGAVNREQTGRRFKLASVLAAALLMLTASTVRFSASAGVPPTAGALSDVAADMAIKSTTGAAVLPNGVVVHLVGITNTQSQIPNRWWTTEGLPQTKTLPANTLVYPSLPSNTVGRAFAVEAEYDIPAQPSESWIAPPGYAMYYDRIHEASGIYRYKPQINWQFEPANNVSSLDRDQNQEIIQGAHSTLISVVPQAVPIGAQSINLRYGVAAGPWTQCVTCRKTVGKVHVPTPSGDVIFTLITNPENLKDPKLVERGMGVFQVSDHFDSIKGYTTDQSWSCDRKVVGLDAAGRVVCDLSGSIMPDGPDKIDQYGDFPNAELAKVTTICLLARPYEWVDFQNIPLNPAAGLQPSAWTHPAGPPNVGDNPAQRLASRKTFVEAVRKYNQAWLRQSQALEKAGYKGRTWPPGTIHTVNSFKVEPAT